MSPRLGPAVKSGVGTAALNKIEVVGEPIVKVQRKFKCAEDVFRKPYLLSRKASN